MNVSITNQLSFCTTRIEAANIDGSHITGTGMFYRCYPKGSKSGWILLITNMHVVKDARSISFLLSRGDENKNIIFGNPIRIELQRDVFIDRFIPHPNQKVDLCAIVIQKELADMEATGVYYHLVAISNNDAPEQYSFKQIEEVASILMIGYPNGLWDKFNNMPIIRSGVTATWPQLDFQGRKEFLIDCACYPDSSGSPVFYYEKKLRELRTDCQFLGILNASETVFADGVVKTRPCGTQLYSENVQHLNLGHVIRFDSVMILVSAAEKYIEQQFAWYNLFHGTE